jgi:hypothetical protein
MTLAEAVAASLVWMVGCGSAAQLWSQGLRASWDLERREAQLDRLESLLVASEGAARNLATSEGPAVDCQVALGQLVPLLQALPATVALGESATLTLPPTGPGLIHLRWEAGGLHRERLLSASALGLCQEGIHGA